MTAYEEARKLVKENKINRTWTRDGDVYIKATENDRAIKVNSKYDLESALQINQITVSDISFLEEKDIDNH